MTKNHSNKKNSKHHSTKKAINHQRRRKTKRRRRLKTKPFLILITIFITIIFFSGRELYNWWKDNINIKNLNQDLDKEVDVSTNDEEGENINPDGNFESDYWYYVTFPFYEVDFTKLLKKNDDTVAYLHMQNNNINYPVVQSNNNSYYLNHAFDKSENSAGWVFMDYRNDINKLDDNTIIYGHGRLDNTVFGTLKYALNEDWQLNKDNYVIWLSTPKQNMMFQIFSIYTIESESYYIRTKFNSKEEKREWINTMKKRNIAPVDIDVDESDYILTLSTCKNNEGGRIVVQAKLIKKQKR